MIAAVMVVIVKVMVSFVWSYSGLAIKGNRTFVSMMN